MTHGVADEGEPFQHDERPHHRADDPDEDRGHEAALHEPVAERIRDEPDDIHQRLPS